MHPRLLVEPGRSVDERTKLLRFLLELRDLLPLEAVAEESHHRLAVFDLLDLAGEIDVLLELPDVVEHPLERGRHHPLLDHGQIARDAEPLGQPLGRIAQGQQLAGPGERRIRVKCGCDDVHAVTGITRPVNAI